jgi:hypothetical protein
MISLIDLISEDLRKWFGKGGKGGVGGGGWDRYNSQGDRTGKCGDGKEGDAYSACLSKEKAKKLGKSGRASFVKRKRAVQKKGGDAKKGGERKKGQKPIKVKTEADLHSKLSRGHKPDYYQLGTAEFKPFDKSRDDIEEGTRCWKGYEKKGMKTMFGKRVPNCVKRENTAPGHDGKAAPYGSGYKQLEEKLNLFLEKNVPTKLEKWAYAKAQAKKKYDVYPSAYANAWAAKKYKELGGGWRKGK